MVTIKVGERVRFSALAKQDADAAVRSSLRPGEVWEGVVTAISADAESGRQVVTVLVDLLSGMRTSGTKEVYADAVTWE